jgi:hypothetical protein
LHEIELTRISQLADLPQGQWNRKRLELLEQAGLPATYAKIMSRYYSDCEGITGDKGIRLVRAIVRNGKLDIFADHETSLRQICEDLGVPSHIEHLLRVHFGRKDNA